MKYAIIGTGHTSKTALNESLLDILTEDDTVLVGWTGLATMSKTMEDTYEYLIENGVNFSLYHRPEQEVIRHFREADNCTVTQSRHPLDAMLKEAEEVLFLWDDAENDANPSLIQYVMDHINDGVQVKELSNGLAPIIIDYEMPEPEPAPQEEPEEEDDTRFTYDELQIMTAIAVKRYGERLGCEAKTKSGIIDELFPTAPRTENFVMPEIAQPEPVEEPQEEVSYPIESVLHDFMDHGKPGFHATMATVLLEQARLLMLKSLSE